MKTGISLFAALLAAVISAHAQFTLGNLRGHVTDPSGAPVSSAKVELKDLSTQAIQTAQTDGSGDYAFSSLQPRRYQLTVSASGFTQVSAAITLGVSQQLVQDFHLPMGQLTQEVTVQGANAAVALQQDSPVNSQLVTQHETASLPVNGRNFLGLAQLGPGAQPGRDLLNNSSNGGSAEYFQTTSQQFIPSGQSVGHTAYLQDGVTNTQLFTQAANILPDLDAIQEFSVETTGMSAQFGQPGVINVITKSGSNSFHGTAYDYLKNSALNANSWFNNLSGTPIPKDIFNQFGGTIGGPVVKDKLFFFFNYEGQRERLGSSFAGRVPTAAERQGDFSAYLTGVPCGTNCFRTVTLYDPTTFNAATGAIAPFSGNIIPTGRIGAFAQKAFQLIPQPLSPILPDGNNYHANLRRTNDLDQYLGRVDYNISERDRLFGTYQFYDQPTISYSFVPDLFGSTYQRVGTNIALEETHTISPTAINTARFGYNRSIFFNSQLGVGSQDWTSYFGLLNLNPPLSQNSPPYISISQSVSLGNPYAPQGATQNLFQFADELDLTRGSHTIKAGAEVNRIQLNGNWTLYNSGLLTFNGQYTSNHAASSALFTQGLGLADLALGFPNSAVGGRGSTVAAFRETDVAGYVNDSWRASPRLTVELGLRYQFNSPPDDKYGHAATYSLQNAASVPGSWNSNFRNFAPRIGLAYSPGRNWVVRSAFGIYYTSTAYNLMQFLLANPPNFLTQSLTYSTANPTPVSSLFPTFASGSTIFAPFAVDKRNPTPYTEQWKFDVQRTFGNNILMDIGYVGNVGHHLSIRLNPNQATPDNPLNPTPLQSRRPYPAIGDVLAQYNIGNANYNALQAFIRKSFTSGLSFQVSYTWSKAIDLLSTDGGTLINGLNARANRGPADFDRPHMLTLSYTYELPFGSGKMLYNRNNFAGKYLLGGWQVNGVTVYGSGLPFTVLAPDLSNTGGNHASVANRSCEGTLSDPTVAKWFDTSCFTQPGSGQSGNSGRNILRQDMLKNWDVSLFKNIPITESMRLQLRGEFFNVFNQHSFLNPDITVGDAQFGRMRGATAPRSAQVALKLIF
jgi:hypothetical protein